MKHLLLCMIWISSVSGFKSKNFEKRYIDSSSYEDANTKVIHKSSGKLDKITCSSFCLKYNSEDCHAFLVNENQCVMVQNPGELREARANSLDSSTPMIWTTKQPLPPKPAEYVMVLGKDCDNLPLTASGGFYTCLLVINFTLPILALQYFLLCRWMGDWGCPTS